MPLFNIRELVAASPDGGNTSEVIINGIHFNSTILQLFNYTYYESNRTLSNGSNCWLAFDAYKPTLFTNGTFINGTSCYEPYYGISHRGGIGIIFACLFGLTIVPTLVNLTKHGRLFLPNEKRFRAIGRRWQWYWMLFVAACGMISGLTGIDVDRDYVLSLPIILQSFFNFLLIPAILAVVWEAVRHWGSWQERQIYDHDPFSLPQDDRRANTEFYLPLVFYLFDWLYFFMTIPRSWTKIQFQRSPEQQNALAKPTATDSRFKIAGFLAFFAWCTICYSLRHSIHHYKPRNRGLFNRLFGFLRYCPTKFLLTIPLLLIKIVYATASAFVWDVSPLKVNGNFGWMYGLGHAPALLILIIFEIWGYLEPNEDRALMTQRAQRGRTLDEELGIVKKPSWWSKLAGDRYSSNDARLKALTTEVGGGRATGRNIEEAIELGVLPLPSVDPFRDEVDEPRDNDDVDYRSRNRGPYADSDGTSTTRAESVRTVSTYSARPQQVRSMLDI